LKPRVASPSAGDSAPGPAYEEKAAKEGERVAAQASQKVPKTEKTTAEKVVPRIHSRRPQRVMRMPPWKK